MLRTMTFSSILALALCAPLAAGQPAGVSDSAGTFFGFQSVALEVRKVETPVARKQVKVRKQKRRKFRDAAPDKSMERGHVSGKQGEKEK